MIKMKKFFIYILSTNLLFGYTMCLELVEPYCLNRSFSSQYEFEQCKRQVQIYLSELQDYAQCLANEIAQKQNEAINKFNCRASGNSFCY